MNDMSKVERGVERDAKATAINRAGDATTVDRLKNLVREKARRVLGLSVTKAALTASGLYLVVSSGCGNVENPTITPTSIPEPTPVSTPVTMPTPEAVLAPIPPPAPTLRPTATLSPTETPKPPEPEYQDFAGDDIKITIDEEGFPVKYVLPDGKEVFFDRDEVRKIRTRAMSSNEPEIITAVLLNDKATVEFNYSSEKPQARQLPKDVLTKEELEKRGIEIIQADNANLYIREGAFAEGAPLEAFNKTGGKLIIALVDGPVVSSYLMSDPKYAYVKARLLQEPGIEDPKIKEESIAQYREKEVEKGERILERLRQKAKELAEKIKTLQNPNQDLLKELSNTKNLILDYKFWVYIDKNMTDKDILAKIASRSSDAAGLYSPGGIGQNSPFSPPIIFLAVGGVGDQEYRTVYFTPEGRVNVSEPTVFLNIDSRPLPSQTHPNPKDFKINKSASPENPRHYLYGGQTPGQSLRHDLKHDVQAREQWIKEGKLPDLNEYNEYKADMKAMDGIREAWEKWQGSGFTDNTGYPFVFSLPEGGYIFTKHRPSSVSSSSGKV